MRGGERVTHFETVRKHKDGSLIDVSLTISPILDPQGRVVGASKIARDITERKRADVKIRHLNRVYAVLSSIDALIVRVRSRDELFRDACLIAVEVGKFKLAWLGIVDRSEMRVKVVAWHGVEARTTSGCCHWLARTGPLAAAYTVLQSTQRKAMISNDMLQDPRILLKKESLELGLRSVVQLPLLIAGEVVGVLALYAGEVGFFDEDEMKLLNELAGDIAFALDHIEKANKVDYLAYYDQLTGLANRTLFLERLSQYVHTARIAGEEIALVLADVERFRTVNDSLGRQAGDELLKLWSNGSRAAQTSARLRESGATCLRWYCRGHRAGRGWNAGWKGPGTMASIGRFKSRDPKSGSPRRRALRCSRTMAPTQRRCCETPRPRSGEPRKPASGMFSTLRR